MKIVTGDLITLAEQGEFDVIIHGCNCFNTMGSGIAAQIRSKYPQAYKADCQTKKGDKSKLGTFTTAGCQLDTSHPFIIVNLYTQYGYNPRSKPCDYHAISEGFKRIKHHFSGVRIAYPQIGAGLAGGDWDVISEIIDTQLDGEDHTLVLWDQQ